MRRSMTRHEKNGRVIDFGPARFGIKNKFHVFLIIILIVLLLSQKNGTEFDKYGQYLFIVNFIHLTTI